MAEITLIFGPMFCGKTTEVIRIVRKHRAARANVLVFKHGDDVRYGRAGLVSSHDRTTLDAIAATTIAEMKACIAAEHKKVDCVCIEEVQFFVMPVQGVGADVVAAKPTMTKGSGPHETTISMDVQWRSPDAIVAAMTKAATALEELIEFVLGLRAAGTHVVLAGLDNDKRRQLWPWMKLVGHADKITKLTAMCQDCGRDRGIYSRCTTENTAIKDVGGAESYVALCADCWDERDRPKPQPVPRVSSLELTEDQKKFTLRKAGAMEDITRRVSGTDVEHAGGRCDVDKAVADLKRQRLKDVHTLYLEMERQIFAENDDDMPSGLVEVAHTPLDHAAGEVLGPHRELVLRKDLETATTTDLIEIVKTASMRTDWATPTFVGLKTQDDYEAVDHPFVKTVVDPATIAKWSKLTTAAALREYTDDDEMPPLEDATMPKDPVPFRFTKEEHELAKQMTLEAMAKGDRPSDHFVIPPELIDQVVALVKTRDTKPDEEKELREHARAALEATGWDVLAAAQRLRPTPLGTKETVYGETYDPYPKA